MNSESKNTVLVPIVHENSMNSGGELNAPYSYRRAFRYHLPSNDCFFIKAGTAGDMKPAIQPGGLALIKPLNLSFPVKHKLIDDRHPRLLNHLELVAIIYKGELLLRRVSGSVDGGHRPVNVYMFWHDPQNLHQDPHPIFPDKENPVRVVGKVVEVINRY